SDCPGCPAYKKNLEDEKPLTCFNADWYSPSWIRYCRMQVLWYLVNCESIREGKWPPEPEGSSYTDPAIRGQSIRVPSRNAEQLAAEIDTRLRRCGIEGKLLEYEVRLEMELSPTSWKVLNYICGWRRKTMSYSEWKSHSRPQTVGKK
ncbi:MAG: hypothetical protein MUP49_05670, partial [Dehalococcoidia bacterium]|nr:hypothetical protein [Dehalococcoidia bacterium]